MPLSWKIPDSYSLTALISLRFGSNLYSQIMKRISGPSNLGFFCHSSHVVFYCPEFNATSGRHIGQSAFIHQQIWLFHSLSEKTQFSLFATPFPLSIWLTTVTFSLKVLTETVPTQLITSLVYAICTGYQKSVCF